jgi:hypothetical protein
MDRNDKIIAAAFYIVILCLLPVGIIIETTFYR